MSHHKIRRTLDRGSQSALAQGINSKWLRERPSRLTPDATSTRRPFGLTASHRLDRPASVAPPRTATAPTVLIRRHGINTPDEIRPAPRLSLAHTPLRRARYPYHPPTTTPQPGAYTSYYSPLSNYLSIHLPICPVARHNY